MIGVLGNAAGHRNTRDGGGVAFCRYGAEIDADAWATLHSDTSRPFPKPEAGRIAVKVINHLGDEVMKVSRVD